MKNIDDNFLRIQEVEEAMKKTKNKRMYQRYHVICLHLKGYLNKDISSIVGLCQHTVGTYVNTYKAKDLEGLVMGKSTGASKLLTSEQEQKLFEVITTQTPDQVGVPNRKNWDSHIACQWDKDNFGVEYTPRGMLDVLRRLNLSYTRPTYTLAKADPQKQEEFKQEFELLKNLLEGKIDHLLFEDESMIRDYQAITKTWFEKGKQRIIPTYGKHKGVKLLGVLNYETGHVYCVEEETYDAEIFVKFLHKLLDLYPTGKIVMILDNSRIHHAKLLEPFLKDNSRLQLVFLPPYSPKLNLIEGLWGWLKKEVICNVFFPVVETIRDAVQGFISSINKVPKIIINRLCVRM